MDANVLLAGASLILFLVFIAYFGYLIYHQQQVEPEEKPVYGVQLLEQHYAPGATVSSRRRTGSRRSPRHPTRSRSRATSTARSSRAA